MSIQRISITNFRNIAQAQIYPSAGINLLVGKNASGKTSFLEAVYLLSLVRSFRSNKLTQLIQHSAQEFTVFAQIKLAGSSSYSLGVQRSVTTPETEILFNNNKPAGITELAEKLPVQLINPDAFRLLEGGPNERRQFLDWGVFHVEPNFIYVWRRFQRALKQRNSLLRHGRMDPLQLDLWEQEIALQGEEITRLRQDYLDQLQPVFNLLLKRFLPQLELDISFQRGWDKTLSLQENLLNARIKDKEQGFTQQGPQRADLRLTITSYLAKDILSRGQQKLVVAALKMAQGKLLLQSSNKHCVYLIDDLPAELDKEHRQVFCAVLEEQASQVFVTGVDAQALASGWQNPAALKLFHVEQGQINPQTSF